MSMKLETDIYRGVIVQTSSDYKLSEYDRLWLHPELCKGDPCMMEAKRTQT